MRNDCYSCDCGWDWKKICMAILALVIMTALITAIEALIFSPKAAAAPIESKWTDQPQFIPNGLVGELLLSANGELYILYWKKKGGFQEFVITGLPEDLRELGIFRSIITQQVIFKPRGLIVELWGFADEAVRQKVDELLFQKFGE